MDPIQRISSGIAPVGASGAEPGKIRTGDSAVPSFEDTFRKFLGDVNSMQNVADATIEKFVAGEIKDVHQVTSALEEARTSFNLMLEIRNKTMEAYQEMMRMQA